MFRASISNSGLIFASIFVFVSLFTVSVMSAEKAEKVVCALCGDRVVPRHACRVLAEQEQKQARKNQELGVALSNERANRKRLEEKYNDMENMMRGIAGLVILSLVVFAVMFIMRTSRK